MALDPVYLKAAFRGQSDWLNAKAHEMESGSLRMIRRTEGHEVDISPDVALDYRARAATLAAIVESYDKRGIRTAGP